ncbi:MAG: anti-sigma factor family protein [Acidobacteriota bacterium]
MSGGKVDERSNGGSRGGRALRCEEARLLLMAFLDGELAAADVACLEDHLAVCVSCRREERAYRKLKEVTEQMGDEELPVVDLDVAWDGIYRRLERAVGWLLLSIGLLILTGYGTWHLLRDFLLDTAQPFLLRVGVGAGAAGLIVLLISIGRERWINYHSERYREVLR